MVFMIISSCLTAQTWDITNFLIERKNIDFDSGLYRGLLIDINNDNLEDLICTQQDFENEVLMDWVVFENTGNGNFIPVNNLLEDGKIQFHAARDYIVADFNNDNKEDVLFAGHGPDFVQNRIKFGGGEQSQLWLQTGSGKLKNVTSSNLPQQKGLTHSIAAGDIDNDGDLDIFVGNSPLEEGAGPVNPRFHLNDGKGFFTDFPNHIPSEVENLEYNVLDWAFIDVDKDGFLDMIGSRGDASYDTDEKDFLLLNDGNLNFNYSSANALPVRGGGLNWGTQEFIISDFNGDGYSDIIASSYTQLNGVKDGQLCYWENTKDGNFTDVSTKIEKSQYLEEGEEWYVWFYPVDLNNDGWMDLCAVADFMPPRIYINHGNGILELVEDIPANFSYVSEILPSDLDFDGDIDLIFLTGESEIYIAWNKNNFSVDNPPLPAPEVPTLVSPVSREAVSKSPTFKWEPNGATVTVHIQVALDEDFTGLVYNNSKITAHNSFKIDLSEENNYYWRIRGTNTAGIGEWSEVQTFESTNIPPDSIELSNNIIYNNVKYGTIVGILSASDADKSDTLSYSLVDGNGSNDINNPSFFIVGDTLKTNTGISKTKDEFFINIKVDDSNGGTYVQDFIINMLPSGLVACYTFNENANDKCGEGYNGTVNGPLLTSDRFDNENSAYNFDGISVSNIYLGKGLGLINNSDEFTICAWINPEKLNYDGTGQSTILGERKEGDNYQFAVLDNKLYFSYWANENEYMFIGSSTIVENSWQFVAVTFNGNQIKLFVNGILDFTDNMTGNMNNHNSSLYIGAFDGENAVFKGKIDDISIYNRCLSESEINEKHKEKSVISHLDEKLFSDQIIIYPNPSENRINIKAFGLNETYDVTIINSLGQIIYNRTNIQPQRIETIDLGNATQGIYFVNFDTKSKRFVKKLIVK